VYDTVPLTDTITIPDGNYNSASIAIEVQKQLDAAFSPLSFECVVSQTTLKCTITNKEGYDVQIHTSDHPTHIEYSKTLPYFLGFGFDTISKGAPLTGQHVVSVNPFTYAYLDIPELGTGAYEGGMYGTRYSPSSNAFAKIPINNNSFEYTFWEPGTKTTVQMNPPVARLDTLAVKWRFHDMTPIDFQNMDHSFSIEFVTRDTGAKHMETIAEHIRYISERLQAPVEEKPTLLDEILAETSKNDTKDVSSPPPPLFSKNLVLALVAISIVLGVWMFSGGRKT